MLCIKVVLVHCNLLLSFFTKISYKIRQIKFFIQDINLQIKLVGKIINQIEMLFVFLNSTFSNWVYTTFIICPVGINDAHKEK